MAAVRCSRAPVMPPMNVPGGVFRKFVGSDWVRLALCIGIQCAAVLELARGPAQACDNFTSDHFTAAKSVFMHH